MFMKRAYLFEYETRGPYNTLVKVPSEIIIANRPRPCHNSRHAHAPESRPRALPSTPAAPTAERGCFHISCDHSSRHFVLYDERGLVTVTVEKKGAQAVQERLEADARTMGDLQR
jgi:hypothetical protein